MFYCTRQKEADSQMLPLISVIYKASLSGNTEGEIYDNHKQFTDQKEDIFEKTLDF